VGPLFHKTLSCCRLQKHPFNVSMGSKITTGKSDAIAQRPICAQCVGESYLRAEIVRRGIKETCHYCGHCETAWSMDELANRVELALLQHFEKTPTEPSALESALINDGEATSNWRRQGEHVVDAIASATDVDENVAEDIARSKY